MLDRTKIPISDDFPNFRFPHYDKLKITENINLFLIENENTTISTINFIIKTGAYDENKNGLASLCAQMLLKGTKTRTLQDIAELSESVGIMLNSNAGYDEIVLSSSSLPDFIDVALELLIDCYLNSIFIPEEFEKLKNKHKASILQNNADINFLAQYGLMQTFYKDTGFEKPITGTIPSISEIERDDVFNYYSEILLTTPFDIIVSGSFQRNTVVDTIQNAFLSKKVKTSNHKKRIFKLNHKTNAIVNKSDSSQAVLRIGRVSINRTHVDFPAFQLVNVIFGGFFMSRLNHVLREQKGYTYGINSMVESRKRLAVQIITTSVNIDKAAESVDLIKDIYKDLILSKITDEETKAAKNNIIGYFLRSTESAQQIAGMVKSLITLELSMDYYDNYYQSIIEVTTQQLREVASKYFSEENFSISTAGDINSLVNQMNKFGKLEIIDIKQ